MPDVPASDARSSGLAVLVACAAGAACFALGWAVLSASHPSEDAYILFRYAEHVAEGHGSVFNVGGPRAEGATDFLWLMALAAGVRAGLDVALAALLLNALGAAALAGWLARSALRARAPAWARAALLPVALSVALGHAALPSYSGFSTLAYAALFGALAELAASPRARTLWRWPALGLALGLFRPDGVVAGVGYAALGLWQARKHDRLRSYLGALALCGALGALYFLARAAYFGLWLPLPLYVKSHPDAAPAGAGALAQLAALLPGLETNWRWLTGPSTPLPVLAVLGVLVLALWRPRPVEARSAILVLVPPALLLAALSAGVQSQNVGFRFQAPVASVALLSMMRAAAAALESFPSAGARVLIVVAALAATGVSTWEPTRVTAGLIERQPHIYLPSFAVMLGTRIEPDRVLAVTEAGLIPYWSGVRSEDIVGLNSPRMAVEGPSLAYLRELDPDLVFFHRADTLDAARLVGTPEGKGVLRLERGALLRALEPRYAVPYALDAPGHDRRGLRPTRTAALVLERFLTESDAYDVLAVDYREQGFYEHVYGIRRGWSLAPELTELLVRTMSREIDLSYLEARRLLAQPHGAAPLRTGSR